MILLERKRNEIKKDYKELSGLVKFFEKMKNIEIEQISDINMFKIYFNLPTNQTEGLVKKNSNDNIISMINSDLKSIKITFTLESKNTHDTEDFCNSYTSYRAKYLDSLTMKY